MADATADARKRMTKAIQALESEFRTIRTGRASASLFDRITVRYYDQDMPLNQVATITVPEARLVVIQPWDLSLLGEVERAIQKSDLSFNPSNDGKVIRIAIPPLTEERRKEIVKQARNAAEQARVAVRNIRRDLNEGIRQDKKEGLGEDEAKRESEQVQTATDERIAEINELLAAKEKEIMEI
jgi:ribosome recycling factor